MLLVLQGMDTAGKGGIVKHVVGAANPQGIRYTRFGVPTEEERTHHYLWRIRSALPTAGHIGVFDRSHYEDVLVVRVHDLVPPEVWGARYDEINAFEKEARRRRHDDRQGRDVRLARRAEEAAGRSASTGPTSTGSTTRATSTSALLWPKYQEAYQAMLDRTSTDYAPWHVVPCDRKWYSRLAIPSC